MGKRRSVPQTNGVLGHALANRYELGPVLGQGGMARVHQGLDRQLGRQVAVKVLAPRSTATVSSSSDSGARPAPPPG